MWGDSRAKLDYAALACKPYSTDPKKKNFLRNDESGNSKHELKIFTSLFKSWIVLEKRRICGNFVPCFYCNLSTAWPNFEQLKWKANEFGQESSHKNTVFGRENNIEFDVNPRTVSALKSRFFENIVIPSKLDANRIIKF